MLPVDKGGNILHGPRPVKRIHGNEVLKTVGFEIFQVFFHTGRLKLEQPRGISPGVELKGVLIIHGQVININLNSPGFFDIGHGIFDNGQGFQSQKVHLEHPHILYKMAVKLGNQEFRFF